MRRSYRDLSLKADFPGNVGLTGSSRGKGAPFAVEKPHAAFPSSCPSQAQPLPPESRIRPPGSPLPPSLPQQPRSYRWKADIWKKNLLCTAWKRRCDPAPRRMGEVKAAIPAVRRNRYLPRVPVSRRHRKSDVSFLLPPEKGPLRCQLESLGTQPAVPSLRTSERGKKLVTTLCTSNWRSLKLVKYFWS